MPGGSQGSPYPVQESTSCTNRPSKLPVISANTPPVRRACRKPAVRTVRTTPRARVRFTDAARVRRQVTAQAAQLSLRGAPREALAAVLALLCGWSRVSDDAIALAQISHVIAASGGRRYDLKTIGRALARLHAVDLIEYRPARGRGRRALIAIHQRFTTGIETLPRDHNGRVVIDRNGSPGTDGQGALAADSVTFSDPPPYIKPITYPPTPRKPTVRCQSHSNRPIEVKVDSQEVCAILRGLPEPFQSLPRNLRWLLGCEVRKRLASGWYPEQIQTVLEAPAPATVNRPWRLALWRLRHNMIGAGPRLKPLQKAWDQQTATTERARHAALTARWCAKVVAVASPDLRADLLRAHAVKFNCPLPDDPVAALSGAGRRATRLFPDLPLAAALARWAANTLDDHREPVAAEAIPVPQPTNTDLFIDTAIGGCECVVCGSHQAIPRPQLPLKSMVCGQCWPQIAAELSVENTETA